MQPSVTLDQAYQICKRITISHYENFPVASILLPRRLRRHVYPIYAFARHADDLADERQDREALLAWQRAFHQAVKEGTDHPVLMALVDTLQRFDLPVQLFDDLISAFLQDLEKTRYRDMPELLDYCRRSANPVGRIILHLHGLAHGNALEYSDAICTALQLTNFWQDVPVDLAKGRIYIPQTFLEKYHITESDLKRRTCPPGFPQLMAELIRFTRDLFHIGARLIALLPFRLAWEIRLTLQGGLGILRQIERCGYDVFSRRPRLRPRDWMGIVFHTVLLRDI